MNTNFKFKGKFIFYPIIGLAFVAAAGYAVMFLWNAILPEVITSVGKVTFWQAVGIFALSRILFGGFKGHGGAGWQEKRGWGWRQKMSNMTEEEREKFKAEWKQKCGRN